MNDSIGLAEKVLGISGLTDANCDYSIGCPSAVLCVGHGVFEEQAGKLSGSVASWRIDR